MKIKFFIVSKQKIFEMFLLNLAGLIISSCGDNTAVKKLNLTNDVPIVESPNTWIPNRATGGSDNVESSSGLKLSAQIRNNGTTATKICNASGFCMSAGFTR